MSIFRNLVASVILVLSCNAQNSMAEAYPDGLIRLAQSHDGTGASCAIPFVTHANGVDLAGNYAEKLGCKNDQMSYFRLETVPSASTFQLHSEKCHGDRDDWNFKMLTTQHPTTTGWIKIADLAGKEKGEIVAPGVRLEDYWKAGGAGYEGKLSCVYVFRSMADE